MMFKTSDEKKREVIAAQVLLENELLHTVIEKLNAKYLRLITESSFDESFKRDYGYIGLKVLGDFKNELQAIQKNARLK